MKPDEFIRSLKGGAPPVTVCTGDEPFFMEEAFEALKSRLEKDIPGLQIVAWETLTGEEERAEANRFIMELDTRSLFCPGKLILIREGKNLLQGEAGKAIEGLISCGGGSNYLCLFTGSIDGRTKTGRMLKKAGSLVECRKLYSSQLFFRGSDDRLSDAARWALQRARSRGLSMEREAASFLISLTGSNLFAIDSELQKMELSGMANGSIGIREIEKVTGMSALHTPFDLWEHMENGVLDKALGTLQVIVKNGMRTVGGGLETDPRGIAAMLLGIFRDRIRLAAGAHVLMHEGASDEKVKKELGLKSAFYFKKIKAFAKRLTPRSYPLLHEAVLQAEVRIKRRGFMPVPVLEETVIRLVRAIKGKNS